MFLNLPICMQLSLHTGYNTGVTISLVVNHLVKELATMHA